MAQLVGHCFKTVKYNSVKLHMKFFQHVLNHIVNLACIAGVVRLA